MKVLILCAGNSARSQMAEALLRHDAGNLYDVFSAGANPTRVRPEAITVMHEAGIDISGHRSKSVDELERQDLDYVITVFDNAKESCPIFPAKTKRIHWSIEDPVAVQGSEEERLAAPACPHARRTKANGKPKSEKSGRVEGRRGRRKIPKGRTRR